MGFGSSTWSIHINKYNQSTCFKCRIKIDPDICCIYMIFRNRSFSGRLSVLKFFHVPHLKSGSLSLHELIIVYFDKRCKWRKFLLWSNKIIFFSNTSITFGIIRPVFSSELHEIRMMPKKEFTCLLFDCRAGERKYSI